MDEFGKGFYAVVNGLLKFEDDMVRQPGPGFIEQPYFFLRLAQRRYLFVGKIGAGSLRVLEGFGALFVALTEDRRKLRQHTRPSAKIPENL